MEISFFFFFPPSTTALATDNHNFPHFQFQKLPFNVKEFQQMKFWRYLFDIHLLLSSHTVFLSPLLVANTSSGTDTYSKMTAKARDFSQIFLGIPRILTATDKRGQSNRFTHLLVKYRKTKSGCPVLCLFYLWLAQNFPNLNILLF